MVAGNIERRSMGALGRMGIVAGAHAVLILLVARGLGIVPPLMDKPEDMTTTIIDEPPPRDDPPPRTEPQIEQPTRIQLPMPPEPPLEQTQESAISAQLVEPDRIVVSEQPGSAEIHGMVVGARQDARHPLSQPRYPSPDIREGNEGNADVEVYVLPNGRVGDARIVRGSGFERLDQSAIEEAKRNWKLVPATRDGVPFAQWYRVRVTFKLTNK